jgi:hypothetical protein
MTGKKQHDDIEPEEPREYSSPACFMHEFETLESKAVESVEPFTLYHNPSCSAAYATGGTQ